MSLDKGTEALLSLYTRVTKAAKALGGRTVQPPNDAFSLVAVMRDDFEAEFIPRNFLYIDDDFTVDVLRTHKGARLSVWVLSFRFGQWHCADQPLSDEIIANWLQPDLSQKLISRLKQYNGIKAQTIVR